MIISQLLLSPPSLVWVLNFFLISSLRENSFQLNCTGNLVVVKFYDATTPKRGLMLKFAVWRKHASRIRNWYVQFFSTHVCLLRVSVCSMTKLLCSIEFENNRKFDFI